MMITQLTVGDWSGDGHEKTRTFNIEHNLLAEGALYAAYIGGCQKLNIVRNNFDWRENAYVDKPLFDVMQLVAQDYEDSTIPEDIVQALIDNGIMPNPSEFNEYDTKEYFDFWTIDNNGEGSVEGSEGFVNLWLAIAKLGNPELEYKFHRFEELDIGGYGIV